MCLRLQALDMNLDAIPLHLLLAVTDSCLLCAQWRIKSLQTLMRTQALGVMEKLTQVTLADNDL